MLRKIQIIFSLGILIFGICGILLGLYFGHKEETLVCSTQKDECHIDYINYYNMAKTKNILPLSQVNGLFIMQTKRISKNTRTGQKSVSYRYHLTFEGKDKKEYTIFSSGYTTKREALYAEKKLAELLFNSQDEIIKFKR